MNAQQVMNQFFNRPARVRVKPPGASRQILGLIEDEGDFDNLALELKRMVELSGMVKPQFKPVVMESWD